MLLTWSRRFFSDPCHGFIGKFTRKKKDKAEVKEVTSPEEIAPAPIDEPKATEKRSWREKLFGGKKQMEAFSYLSQKYGIKYGGKAFGLEDDEISQLVAMNPNTTDLRVGGVGLGSFGVSTEGVNPTVSGAIDLQARSPIKKIDDGVITKDGQVIETHPDDNIYATKNNISTGGGGGKS